MPEQLTLFLPPVPVALPDKPPAPKRERLPKFCTGCGVELKGLLGLGDGTLCGDCIPPSSLPPIPPGRVCGEHYRPRRCNCEPGECEAIPW